MKARNSRMKQSIYSFLKSLPIISLYIGISLGGYTSSIYAQSTSLRPKSPRFKNTNSKSNSTSNFDPFNIPPPPPPLPKSSFQSGKKSNTTSTPQATSGKTNGNQKIGGEKSKMDISKAQPEDITNENFPDLVESFDYPNADISEVVKAISKLTGKNFILDSGVRGKITIIAPSQITVAEAYRAFLSALAMNDLTVVPSGAFLKIRNARNAQRDSIETYAGRYFPNTDQIITRIIKLKYISAETVFKNLRILNSKDGEAYAYGPTNSLIITDFGSHVERVVNILKYLDVPGFEEQLAVIRIKYAKSKDISDLIDKIINKGDSSNSRFPRFRRTESNNKDSGSENYSLVLSDDRTNSIIVVGNKAGITKIKNLVAKLDFRLRPEESGGVFVYYVRHGEAEKIANVLNGIASESKKANQESTKSSGGGFSGGENRFSGAPGPVGETRQAVFGGDVTVTAEKDTNSLVISASRPDYQVVLAILKKIDIARDQVFVKTIIMEMNADNTFNWGLDYYKFDKDSKGVGRFGFRSTDSIAKIASPAGDSGAVIGYGSGDTFDLNLGTGTVTVTSFVSLLNLLKKTTGANVLSEPQIMALDNEESVIEVGQEVPVGKKDSTTGSTVTSSIERKKATIKLKLTPYISPDTDSVRMKIDQQISQLSTANVKASALAEASVITNERAIQTNIIVDSGDTAVLGGLMSDEDSETITKIPILGDIPILGWLFKSKQVDKVKKNLMVLITPKIIRNGADGSAVLDQKLDERISFIQKNLNGRDPYGDTLDTLPRKAYSQSHGINKASDSLGTNENSSPGSTDGSFDDASPAAQEEPATESF